VLDVPTVLIVGADSAARAAGYAEYADVVATGTDARLALDAPSDDDAARHGALIRQAIGDARGDAIGDAIADADTTESALSAALGGPFGEAGRPLAG
jgi:hypothetical protein